MATRELAPPAAAEPTASRRGRRLAALLRRLHVQEAAVAEPAPPPREPTFAERQLAGAEQRAAACAYETKHLWLCSDAGGRLAARPFFALLGDPAWRLESHDAASGLSTWRLSKEGAKIHTIMGVVDVHASPRVALRLFDDYGRLMGSVFRRIDPMFVRGRVVGTAGNRADLAAVFRLPAVVGSGAAPLFRPREFVWRQHVTRLHGGGVLVTGSSAGAAEAAPERGTVRGVLHTSGYYGQPLPGGRTRLWYVASADPALFLPGWLINLVVARQAQNAVRLAALFRTGHLVL